MYKSVDLCLTDKELFFDLENGSILQLSRPFLKSTAKIQKKIDMTKSYA